MQPIWKKLNLKAEPHITVIDAPESFEVELDRLGAVGVKRKLLVSSKSTFLIAFVTQRARIKALAGDLKKMAEGDVIVWFCYPKKSSKRYTCEFDRDSGWDPLGAAGFEGVRQVAIDEAWSALRFRRVEHIGKLKRDPERALTPEGKRRSRGAEREPGRTR